MIRTWSEYGDCLLAGLAVVVLLPLLALSVPFACVGWAARKMVRGTFVERMLP